MAWVGQPWAARMIFSSGAAVGSMTTAIPSSSRSNTPGAQNEQLPEPMHASRSILMSSATGASSKDRKLARDLAEPGVAIVGVGQPLGRRVDDARGTRPARGIGHRRLEPARQPGEERGSERAAFG